MITLTENWKLKSDSKQWILINEYDTEHAKSKTGRASTESYHRTLEQVSRYILNQEAKAAEGLEYILDIIGNVEREISHNLIKNIGERK